MAVLKLLLLAALASAIQVTPNSPCSAVCIDATDLDVSDPNSSNTGGKDIVCTDEEFDTNARGQKFKACLTCLQTSTHVQGSENDQAWFLYNLRYAFDYCIFGYPNATNVVSSPCLTPESCGGLAGLKENITKPVTGFGYCNAGLPGPNYDSCLQCVQADGDHRYLSNFFVALEAGCKQRPQPTTMIGLNETLFTHNVVAQTQPSISPTSTPSPGMPLSGGAITGIAIGGFVFVSLLAGCVYMQYRKRKNKNRSRRTMSFRCKSAAAPQRRPYQDDDDDRFFADKGDGGTSAVSMSPVARSKPFLWEGLNISTGVPCPEPAYTSPRMAGFSPDDATPPTSTISSAPLLGWGSSAVGRVSPAVSQGQFQDEARQDGRMGRRGTPGSPVHTTTIQTKFDPPPTR